MMSWCVKKRTLLDSRHIVSIALEVVDDTFLTQKVEDSEGKEVDFGWIF